MTWALDLGTTNTGLARWDSESDSPQLVELPAICRKPGRTDPLEAPRMVPSAVAVMPGKDLATRLGRWPWLARRVYWGRQGIIGRDALDRFHSTEDRRLCRSFKSDLLRRPTRPLAHFGQRSYDARQLARIFLRELFAETYRNYGEKVRDLVVTAPVDSFDTYRSELSHITKAIGVQRLRLIDEPVAAALGYGMGLDKPQLVLVVDFGGGTLDLAVTRISPREAAQGHCEVLAKEGRPIGGRTIDQWLLDFVAEKLDVSLQGMGSEVALWRELMFAEAHRVKEAVYFKPTSNFSVVPGEELRGISARLRDRPRYLEVSRDDLNQLLQDHQLYDMLEDCCVGLDQHMMQQGIDPQSIDEVLMVGGSTLLPGVYRHFEHRYGRDKVRAWQPFEAVAWGAAAYAAGRIGQSDYLVHDYAMVALDPKSLEKQYLTIIPRGTRFPTPPDFWKRRFVPTCALGEPERRFELVVAELSVPGSERRFAWDADGQLQRAGGDALEPIIVPLNADNPTLGTLDPPHQPKDRAPRLEISFGVDENRWLIVTVQDLKTDKTLLRSAPVARLL